MRTCCIIGCQTSSADIGRTLFEINRARNKWKDLIEASQLLPDNEQLFICDFHFDSKDIKRHKTRTTLHKDAVPNLPNLSTRISDRSFEDDLNFLVEELQYFDVIEEFEEDVDNTQFKTITVAEFKTFMSLVAKVDQLKRTIKKMAKDIKDKDTQLKRLYAEEKRWKNSDKLSIEQTAVIDCLKNGMRGNQYIESIRKFCLRQQYYSQAAYESLRNFFNNNLPSKRTLQMWYSSIDGSPGVCESALSTLSEKAQSYRAEYNHRLHVALISDEIAIRKHVDWNSEKEVFVGFSTITNSSQHNIDSNTTQLKIAKDALVFLVVGPDFKLPIAYHLLNGLDGIDRAALTLEVIRKIENTGVQIISLTSDGLFANLTVAELLGADFEKNKPYFGSPTYAQSKIFIIFDPPHMLKLIRNHFSRDKIYHNNSLLDWNLLKLLVKKQSMDNFNLCNKLTQRHIDWYQKPMNVKLAAQTISRSVADTLQQLRDDQYEEFKDCTETVEFLRIINDGFDVQNVAEKNSSDLIFKQPICNGTVGTIFAFGRKLQQYISELTIQRGAKRIPILKSQQKMGFFGFYYNFQSMEGIYEDFVKSGPLTQFFTFQFSQDHIETFFSLIRNRQGRNDNPNAVEFASAFRKLLVCHPLITSVDHNVLTNSTGILTATSRQRKSLPVQQTPVYVDLEIQYEELMMQERESMDAYDEHMVAYVALCTEEKVLEEFRIKKKLCSDCATILLSPHDQINDEFLAMKKKPRQPNASTVDIVIFSNAVIQIISSHDSGRSFDNTWRNIYSNINVDELYAFANFLHEQDKKVCDHKEEFIVRVIKTYLKLKSKKIGQKLTDEERGELIRNRRKHAIHEAGQ